MAWMQQLGEEIAKARRKAGLTQDDLHQAVGVSRNMIGSYERGEVPPAFETLASIANALNANEFVVEDLHITFSRNGSKAGLETIPQQLNLDFDENGGVTVRIETTGQGQGVIIKKLLA